ncbi:hypothetical protein GCM10018777_08980 [Streptomyces albogriseolus]|nr:hypothetical protein GCM10018777_08980 [Streptomyces viridodiastaticus]
MVGVHKTDDESLAARNNHARLNGRNPGSPEKAAMAGPQQRLLLRGVVASHAMPAIVRHPARRGSTARSRIPRL